MSLVRGLYAILDAEVLARRGMALRKFAEGLRAAEVTMVQLRAKGLSPQEVLEGAAVLSEVFRGIGCRLIMNDRLDLAVIAGFDGVHVGQEDLPVEDAKTVALRAMPTHRGRQRRDEWGTQKGGGLLVGVSTHTGEQVRAADAGDADYVAIGPVFATGTKVDAAAVVGLDGVRRARDLTNKSLVAIGGITRDNARAVLEAGADSVTVISGLLVEGESVEDVARDFMRILR